MRSRACYSTEVTETDEFLELSLGARALYFHLLPEADGSGHVIGIRRAARGVGLLDMLPELYESGYLLDVDGECYITHEWVNNKYDGRVWERAMTKCEPFKAGRLSFAGEEGKSAYVLVEPAATPERRQSDARATQNRNLNGNVTGTEHEPNFTFEREENRDGKGESKGGGGRFVENAGASAQDTRGRCECVKCHTESEYFIKEGATFIECPKCGTYQYQPRRREA
ncbi:MAG: hypothetical protein IKG22_04030 [Atopobiaceae bacterium]|nr:hypothetical protein [Atopobiaceae bacterium]